MDKERKADAGTKATHGFSDMPSVRRPIDNVTRPTLEEGGIAPILLTMSGVSDLLSAAKSCIRPQPHPLRSVDDKFEIAGVAAVKTGRRASIVTEKSSRLCHFLREIDFGGKDMQKLSQSQPDR